MIHLWLHAFHSFQGRVDHLMDNLYHQLQTIWVIMLTYNSYLFNVYFLPDNTPFIGGFQPLIRILPMYS